MITIIKYVECHERAVASVCVTQGDINETEDSSLR